MRVAAAARLWVLAAATLLATATASMPPDEVTLHRTLLGPFASVAPGLHLQSTYKPLYIQTAPRDEVVAPRRALRQATTEKRLTIVLLLLIDFFAGFYTGYLRGFFT